MEASEVVESFCETIYNMLVEVAPRVHASRCTSLSVITTEILTREADNVFTMLPLTSHLSPLSPSAQ